MSTTGDIFTRIDELLDSITELFASRTVEWVIELIESTGGGDTVHRLLVDVKALLISMRAQVTRLIGMVEEPLRHVNALDGLIELLRPLMAGLQDLVAISQEELEKAGLESTLQIDEPISLAVDYGAQVLDVGASILDTLPEPGQLREIDASFEQLIGVIQEYVEATA